MKIDTSDIIKLTSKHNFDFIRGNILYTTSKLKNLKKQSKSSITKELKKHLNSFYDNTRFCDKIWALSFINTYPISDYQSDIYIKNNTRKDKFLQILHNLNFDGIHFFWSTINKYIDINNVTLWDKYFEYDTINQLWKIVHKKEKYQATLNYINNCLKLEHKYPIPEVDVKQIVNNDIGINIKIKLSNSIKHKLDSVKINKNLWVCQHRGNADYGEYAQWYYDYFTNWAMYVLEVYVDKQQIGRSACKIFYDDKGKEYLFIERIYILDSYGNKIQNIKESITAHLSTKFNVVIWNWISVWRPSDWVDKFVTNFDGIKISKLDTILRWPVRKLITNMPLTYYKDSVVYSISNNKWVSAYDIIIPNSQAEKIPALPNQLKINISSSSFYLIEPQANVTS